MEKLLLQIQTRISQNLKTWIVTANPEILFYAKNHKDYWEALRQADIRCVDGFGLKMAGWLKNTNSTRVSGVELAEKLAELCAKNNWTMALVGGKEGVADKAAWYLRKRYPGIKVWCEQGGSIGLGGELDEKAEAGLVRLQEYEPKVVLVAFGHPRQEMWIWKHSSHIKTAQVLIGVGGTFDYWAGTVPRAPRWMRRLGFEWLFRLIKEPKRWKRIWNALVVFPLTVILGK